LKREYCTLFDSNYLVKFVAMHESLCKVGAGFQITAFCFDDLAYEMLEALGLEGVSRVSLAELEAQNPALLGVKSDRSPVEYCWTATPALPMYIFATRPELDEITYLDADLMFFSSPEPIFNELGDDSILITPHRFAPQYAAQVENGIYNVQFMSFRRDGRGIKCLQWWHDRCIEWCYYRLEDGRLGDQKYLDDWPERFEGVHVLEHKGGGLGPWNIPQYDLSRRDGIKMVDDDPLIFFHYHRVKTLHGGRVAWRPPGYAISRFERRFVYDPYIAALHVARERVLAVDPSFSAGLEHGPDLSERARKAVAGARASVKASAIGTLVRR